MKAATKQQENAIHELHCDTIMSPVLRLAPPVSLEMSADTMNSERKNLHK
jgi:hypothetical protein